MLEIFVDHIPIAKVRIHKSEAVKALFLLLVCPSSSSARSLYFSGSSPALCAATHILPNSLLSIFFSLGERTANMVCWSKVITAVTISSIFISIILSNVFHDPCQNLAYTALAAHCTNTSLNSRFRSWTPQLKPRLEPLLAPNGTCYGQYETYIATPGPGKAVREAAGVVVSCLLGAIREDIKANMGAAAVVLGLAPTVLTLMGTSTTERSILFYRRPVLASLLSMASPAVCLTRTAAYRDPLDLLRRHDDQLEGLKFTQKWSRVTVWALQYILTSVSIYNVIDCAGRLSRQTTVSFCPDTPWLPITWVVSAWIVHVFGLWALRLRIRLYECDRGQDLSRRTFWRTVKEECQLSVNQPPLTIETKKETRWFICVSWFTSVGTSLHILFGTLVLSSLLFISTSDALLFVSRFSVSVIFCRALVWFELSGMRMVMQADDSTSITSQPTSGISTALLPSTAGKSSTVHTTAVV